MQHKNIKTTFLNITYLEQGPKDGPAVLLLHGWPDDATTWEKVIPAIADKGYRVIAPWLRGYSPTVFRFPNWLHPRKANSGVLALDAIALMDKLAIKEFSVLGHDWGANIAESLVVGWPKRVKSMALLSTPPRLGGMPTPDFYQCQRQWYHWFQATKRGSKAVKKDPISFSRIMWDNWSPQGWYNEETFQAASQSWKNPDFVPITLHSYRARWQEAKPALLSIKLEKKVQLTKTLSLPTLFVQGEVDGVNPPYMSENIHEKFTGPFRRVIIPGVGHFPTREAPEETSRNILLLLDGKL